MEYEKKLRVLRDRWLTIVIIAAVGCAMGVIAFIVRPASYTAQTSLYVSAQIGDSPQQAYQGAQLSEQRVKSYTELATGPRVVSETLEKLGPTWTYDEIRQSINATSALDSVIIEIDATAESGPRAAQLANELASSTIDLVNELEQPAYLGASTPVVVRVVQPAFAPTEPSSVGWPVTVGLGLLAGLALGIAGAFMRDSLDKTLRSVDELVEVAAAPALGALVRNDAVQIDPLFIVKEPSSPLAEGYRQIRTNLQYVDVDKPRKVVLFTSARPGEGKSTTTANLALAMSAVYRRVLVIEADLRRPTVSQMFGLDRSVGLTRILTGQIRWQNAVQSWGGGVLDILSSGPTPPNPSELLASGQMKNLIDEVREAYDVVLVDSPPILPVTDSTALAPLCDATILVCAYKKITVPQLTLAVSALKAVSVVPSGTVMTMTPKRGQSVYSSYDYSADQTPTKLRNLNTEKPASNIPYTGGATVRLDPRDVRRDRGHSEGQR